MRNAHHKFPEAKLTCSNCLFFFFQASVLTFNLKLYETEKSSKSTQLECLVDK